MHQGGSGKGKGNQAIREQTNLGLARLHGKPEGIHPQKQQDVKDGQADAHTLKLS